MSESEIDREEENLEDRMSKRKSRGSNLTNIMVDRLMTLYEKDLRYRKIRVIFLSLAVFLGATYYITFDKIFNPANFVGDYVSLVRMQGEIGPDEKISAQKIIPALTKAFKNKEAAGVVILINSPGGSPVQSSLIHDRIIQLRKQYPDKKVVVVAEDVMASGGYFIATGADTIYVNRSTLIGSIGVRMDSFGVDLSKAKYDDFGIERRTITQGRWKNRLDMFKPLSDEDLAWAKSNLKKTHQHFIDAVLETRADKLQEDHGYLFSGDIWNGEDGVKLGLADGLSDLATVLKDEFGVEGVVDYTPAPSFFNKIQESYGVSGDLKPLSKMAKILSGGPTIIEMH